MNPDAALAAIKEGGTTLRVPSDHKQRGPGKRRGPLFYNRAGEKNRSLSVLIAATENAPRPIFALDGLSASGVRGLRWMVEAGVKDVTLNDRDPAATELEFKNAEANSVAPQITNRDLNSLMSDERYDLIDIDPFGTPAPFLDAIGRSLKRGGLVSITATDTACLAGTSPAACKRKYLATPLRFDAMHETGLRILAGAAIRAAAKYDVALKPLLVETDQHYYRVHLRSAGGAATADKTLDRLGVMQYCTSCLRRALHTAPAKHCECGGPLETAGPLWAGPIFDESFIEELHGILGKREFHSATRLEAQLGRFAEEARVESPSIDVHVVARGVKASSIPFSDILQGLRAVGFKASRTSLIDTGIRTDASPKEIQAILLEAKAR
ncbi:MAG: tRNA (guanine(10)-N(2))-dimethyltransferase [Euryarchaeota archaeon]|nr:tRNA (guanine(10)-N(2))-dimethyltransferase [Euryarchaeota archaeon]